MLTLAKTERASTNPRHWKPGQSGNPIGRRAEVERYGTVDIAALARSYGPEAIKTLVHCLRDPRYKLAAAIALLDRGYGKPHVSVHTQSEGTVLHLIAAEAVGNAIIDAVRDGPVVDADVAKDTVARDDTPPLE